MASSFRYVDECEDGELTFGEANIEVIDEHAWFGRVVGMKAWQTRSKTMKEWSLGTRRTEEPEPDRGGV